MSTAKHKTMQDFEELKKQQDDSFIVMKLKPTQLEGLEPTDRPIVAKKQSAQQSTMPLTTALPVSHDKVLTDNVNPNVPIV